MKNPIQAINGKEQYNVTVMSDSNLFDGHGFVHTWLKFETWDSEGKKQERFFTFGTPNNLHMVLSTVGFLAKGTFDHDSMEGRPPTATKTYDVTKDRYDAMMEAIEQLEQKAPNYTMVPSSLTRDRYNCTTAVTEILNAGGIDEFNGIQTPNGITSQIRGGNGSSNFIENIADMVTGVLNQVGDFIGKWLSNVLFPKPKEVVAEMASAGVDDMAIDGIDEVADTTAECMSADTFSETVETLFDNDTKTVYLATDILPDAVTLDNSGAGLVLNVAESNVSLNIDEFFTESSSSEGTHKIQFADGTVWLPQDISSYFNHNIKLPVGKESSALSIVQAMNQGISQFMAMEDDNASEVVTGYQSLVSSTQQVNSWAKQCY